MLQSLAQGPVLKTGSHECGCGPSTSMTDGNFLLDEQIYGSSKELYSIILVSRWHTEEGREEKKNIMMTKELCMLNLYHQIANNIHTHTHTHMARQMIPQSEEERTSCFMLLFRTTCMLQGLYNG
jgi:hypothetical protein